MSDATDNRFYREKEQPSSKTLVNCGYVHTVSGWLVREGAADGEHIATFKRQQDADDYVRSQRLRERVCPSKVVMIEGEGHYVSEAVFAEIERLRAAHEPPVIPDATRKLGEVSAAYLVLRLALQQIAKHRLRGSKTQGALIAEDALAKTDSAAALAEPPTALPAMLPVLVLYPRSLGGQGWCTVDNHVWRERAQRGEVRMFVDLFAVEAALAPKPPNQSVAEQIAEGMWISETKSVTDDFKRKTIEQMNEITGDGRPVEKHACRPDLHTFETPLSGKPPKTCICGAIKWGQPSNTVAPVETSEVSVRATPPTGRPPVTHGTPYAIEPGETAAHKPWCDSLRFIAGADVHLACNCRPVETRARPCSVCAGAAMSRVAGVGHHCAGTGVEPEAAVETDERPCVVCLTSKRMCDLKPLGIPRCCDSCSHPESERGAT